MKFGAEPKKTAVLAGLVLVGGYFFYENVIATPGGSEPARAVRPSGAGSATSASALLQEQAAAHKTIVPATSSEEWLPSLKEKRPEDGAGTTRVVVLGPSP